MSNVDTLAVGARADNSLMSALWDAVERLVGLWVSDYRKSAETRLYDADDLTQAAYIALYDAVQGYDPDKSGFNTYLHYHVRVRFAEVSGRRGAKQRPELYAASLDVPLAEDNDTTRLESLEDPDAHYAYEDLIECLGNRQDYDLLMIEVDKLPAAQREVIRLNVCEGRSSSDTAAVLGCSAEDVRRDKAKAIRAVQSTKTARRIRRERYSWRRVSWTEFRSTHTSEQEAWILWLEERGALDLGYRAGNDGEGGFDHVTDETRS